MPRKAQSPLAGPPKWKDTSGPNSNGATVTCLGPVQPPHERPYGQFCPRCEWKAFVSEATS